MTIFCYYQMANKEENINKCERVEYREYGEGGEYREYGESGE
jgi:hypothetical protein